MTGCTRCIIHYTNTALALHMHARCAAYSLHVSGAGCPVCKRWRTLFQRFVVPLSVSSRRRHCLRRSVSCICGSRKDLKIIVFVSCILKAMPGEARPCYICIVKAIMSTTSCEYAYLTFDRPVLSSSFCLFTTVIRQSTSSTPPMSYLVLTAIAWQACPLGYHLDDQFLEFVLHASRLSRWKSRP